MKKSKNLIILIIVLGLIFFWSMGSYNGLISSDENVQKAWAQVENVYQRRADLIPNLINTVKGAADFERQTLTDVIDARANAVSVKLDPTNLTENNIAAFQKAQDRLSSTLSRLMMVVERYPDLKANQNFLELQSQLEGTENRITVERQKFNEVVKQYNTKVRRFPDNMTAKLFGFNTKGYFTAQQGAEKAPEVNFDFSK